LIEINTRRAGLHSPDVTEMNGGNLPLETALTLAAIVTVFAFFAAMLNYAEMTS
jgi:hypothetical protein